MIGWFQIFGRFSHKYVEICIGLHESKTIQYFCNYCLALVNS